MNPCCGLKCLEYFFGIRENNYVIKTIFLFALFTFSILRIQTKYCSTFHCSSVRPSVTGVTSQLFSIIWWFRAWKPCIFWKYVILHKHLDNRLPALDIHVTSCQMKYWQRFYDQDMSPCLNTLCLMNVLGLLPISKVSKWMNNPCLRKIGITIVGSYVLTWIYKKWASRLPNAPIRMCVGWVNRSDTILKLSSEPSRRYSPEYRCLLITGNCFFLNI